MVDAHFVLFAWRENFVCVCVQCDFEIEKYRPEDWVPNVKSNGGVADASSSRKYWLVLV
jgi:hypothetical protein